MTFVIIYDKIIISLNVLIAAVVFCVIITIPVRFWAAIPKSAGFLLEAEMKKIAVTQGKFTIVDDEWFEYLSTRSWYIDPNGYVVNKTDKVIFMHRLIAGTPNGMSTDHINGNKLDNRNKNLRTCTTSQNMANRGKQVNNTSGYKGVFWHRKAGRWRAQIRHNRKSIHLGLFDTREEAAVAYNKKALEIWGEFAKLNDI